MASRWMMGDGDFEAEYMHSHIAVHVLQIRDRVWLVMDGLVLYGSSLVRLDPACIDLIVI